MNSKKIAFIIKVLENEIINISDSFPYEDYDSGLEKKEMRVACEKTIAMLKKLNRENKKKLKKR
jgi:hypothetical protein